MKSKIAKVLLAGSVVLCVAHAIAQTYSIDRFTIAGGSGTVSGGAYSISGTAGQPDGNLALSGGGFSMTGGFWSITEAISGLTTIFDNTSGSENGYGEATSTTWLASEFCLGSQAYTLDSVTLPLSTFDFNSPVSTVRLQIYSEDSVSGRPSSSTGLTMNLSGATNPITFTVVAGSNEKPITWTAATPFILSPNTCYWAVLSVDSGASVWQAASSTRPTGDAGSFGLCSSSDAGATWGSPDNFDNRKMLIKATPVAPPSSDAELAADGSTAIPGGTGNFTSLPFAPSLSGSNLVFYGAGSGGQQGIYLMNRGFPVGPTRVADLNTPIPGGTGNFLSLGSAAGIIIVGGAGEAGIIIVGGDVLFYGRGSGSQQGIYLSSHASPTVPYRIADTATAIPGGVGTFAGFQNALGFDGSDVAFVGSGSGGQQGIYGASVAVIGPPFKVADTATAIPGGSGNFVAFPAGPALSGSELAFIGNGSAAQQGLYTVAVLAPPQVGSPLRIADTTTAIPGGSGNFTSVGSDQAHPVDPAMSGDRLAFVGSGSGGQQGIFGASVALIGPPFKVADTATAIPSGSGNFASFSAVSVSATDLVFLAAGAGGQSGIYDMTGGQLRKVISVGDVIQGKMITGLGFSRGGLFGDPIAFQATFSDGSEGVYAIDVLVPSAELRINAVGTFGTDLRLSFNSLAGQNYAIQSRAVLTSGTWTTLPGGPTSGTGGTVEVTLPNALVQPQQFYRVMVVP